jgi:hypothetical protein
VGQRELEALDKELLDVRAADVVGLLELNNLEDLRLLGVSSCSRVQCTYLDRPEAGSVTGGHILVQSVDGGNAGHLTVLLVHVVGAGARVVADPDAEVLDLLGALLGDLALSGPYSYSTHLVQGDDLAVRLLDLAELAEEVPEPRLGDNIVGRKNAHAVDLGGGVGLAGEVAADDLVFLEAS